MTVNEIYQSGLKLLENNNIENSKFEAQSLLQKAFSLDRIGFIIHKTDKADENCSHNFFKFIEKQPEQILYYQTRSFSIAKDIFDYKKQAKIIEDVLNEI